MTQSYLSDILHVVAQWLLVPDIILLLLFIGYALFCIGSVLTELFTERKHFKVVMPQFLKSLMDSNEETIPAVIEESGLLNRQKQALMTVYEYRDLPGDALLSLVKREVSQEESRYDAITGRNSIAARVAPMLGLMGTLIPLGPGIEALGRADTAALSSSLLVAFDTTVAGLVVAAVCLVVGKVRSNWYNDYMSALDSAMATMLEKIEAMRGAPKPQQVASAPESKLDGAAAMPKDASVTEEIPATEKASVVEKAPMVQQVPEAEEASAIEETPTAEAPAIEEAPTLEASTPESEPPADGESYPKKATDLLDHLFEAEPKEVAPATVGSGPAALDTKEDPAASGSEADR